MKNYILPSFLIFFAANCFAQDSVSLGAGYQQDVFFSLKNGIVQTAPSKNWDVAFGVYLFDAAVIINSENGVTLYNVAKTDTSGWATLDTTGLSTWPVLYNSDTSWNIGAFNAGENIQAYNYGWGMYDITTNTVKADSLFVLKLVDSSGTHWKKFSVLQRTLTGTYLVRYANLDNSDEVYDSIPVLSYGNKLFVYYSVRDKQISDREPDKNSWDLLFTKYITYIPIPGIFYPVTGVLNNYYSGFDPSTFGFTQYGNGTQAYQANDVNQQTVEFDPKQDFFTTDISEIGYDWKTFDMSTGQYTISDSTAYFVKDLDSTIYRIYFTAYDLVNSTFFFNLEKAVVSGIGGVNDVVRSMGVFPNPAKTSFTLAYDLQQNVNSARMQILNAAGVNVYENVMDLKKGFHQQVVELPRLTDGVYMVRIIAGDASAVARLTIAQ